MKILLVAMSDSIHTARWLTQADTLENTFYLFPSLDHGLTHEKIKNTVVYHSFYGKQKNRKNVKNKGFYLRNYWIAKIMRYVWEKLFSNYRKKKLIRLIKKINPDILHSLETQAAGYLVAEVKKDFRGKFPLWIHTNWGSDLFLFGRLKNHQPKIREVLENCDYYSCECQRDIELAKKYGLKGKTLPVFPNTGGFDLALLKTLSSNQKPSDRKKIMLKGYQGWAGRCLVGLRALERAVDLLKNYEIYIYSANTEDVFISAELFSTQYKIPVYILPKTTSHEEILTLHGQSRISMGISISDAISTSLLESMSMGSFPIQSWTACANEWIQDGETGLLVSPEDPDVIEKAIRKALTDDELVNTAALKNWQIVLERLDQKKIKPKIDCFYQVALKNKNEENEK